MLSLRSKRYIADVWLAGYTESHFRQKIKHMNLPQRIQGEAILFFCSLDRQLRMSESLHANLPRTPRV